MKKETKYDYWIIYIDKDVSYEIPSIINKDTLIYAYTDNESLIPKFSEVHNMDLFTVRKLKLTKEKIHYLSKMERDKYLVERKILTKDNKGCKKYIKLCVTMEEDKITKACTSSKVMEFVYKVATDRYPKKLFKKEAEEILSMIGFFDTADMFAGVLPITADSEKLVVNVFDKKINLYVDELAIFCNVFSSILKVG